MSNFTFETLFFCPPNSFSEAPGFDILWMVFFSIVIGTPMWTGWNAERVHDSGPQQRVFYMKHI